MPHTEPATAPTPSQTGAVILPMQQQPVSLAWAQEVLRQCPLILISDGLDDAYQPQLRQLESMGCVLLYHAVPLGLGRCIKTGLQYYQGHYPQGIGVVISGQREPFALDDLPQMLRSLTENPLSMTLGVAPHTRDTSINRRIEYWLCRQLFAVVCGKRMQNVRSPLRSLPMSLLPKAAVLEGEDESYMLNLLLVLCRNTVPVQEVPISQHASLDPIPLGMWGKLLVVIAAFLLSSVASAIIDYALFIFMQTRITPVILTCQVVARAISSVFNFTLNRKLVFAPVSGKGALGRMLAKYYILVIFSLGISTALLYLITHLLPISPILAKPVVEAFMYILNFVVQRDVVFKSKKKQE